MKLARALLIVCAISAPAVPCEAQWSYKLPPASSPYWWTLTDEISPQELRRQHNPANKRARYLAAVEADLYEPLPEHQLNDILVFSDGRVAPEYNRLPDVLGLLCGKLEFNSERWLAELEDYGFTESERSLLQEAAHSRDLEIKASNEARREGRQNFLAVLEAAKGHYSSDEYKQILKARSYGKLAQITNYSPSEIREFADDWDFDTVEESDIVIATFLKGALSEGSWEKLRRFLLERVSPDFRLFELGDGELDAEL